MSTQLSSADDTQLTPCTAGSASDETVATPIPPGNREQDLIRMARGQISALPSGTSDPTAGAEAPNIAGIPPDAFAGYKLIRKIHGGGQGVVFLALQIATGKKVALKVVREGPFADPRNKARLERGIRILAQLNHPQIVGIIDSGVASGTLFYVMDYIAGCSLDEFVERGRASSNEIGPGSRQESQGGRRTSGGSSRKQKVDIRDTLRLFVGICEALNAAHVRGIIHRDIKPGNIRVDEQGKPHILDFDLAKFIGGGDLDSENQYINTQTGEFIGSLRWASPEQVERRPGRIDMRTDVYSLGVVLYEMLTAQYPYPVVGTRRDIEEHILRTAPIRPSGIRRQIDSDIETILLTCLSKEPQRRYQNAGALAEDIHRYLNGEAIAARTDSPLYVLRKMAGRHKLATIMLAAVIVTIISSAASVGFIYSGWRSEHDRIDALSQASGERNAKVEVELKRLTDDLAASQLMAWFLTEYAADREAGARMLMNQLATRYDADGARRPRPETLAMRFLLDPRADVEQFRAALGKSREALAELVIAERYMKAGRPELAARAYANAAFVARPAKSGPSLYSQVAESRLEALRAKLNSK